MVRTDTNGKRESHQEAEVTQDLGHGRGVIVVEAGRGRSLGPEAETGRSLDPEAETGKSPGPEAGTENGESDRGPALGQDTGIGVEAEVGRGVEVAIERRGLKNPDDLVEV